MRPIALPAAKTGYKYVSMATFWNVAEKVELAPYGGTVNYHLQLCLLFPSVPDRRQKEYEGFSSWPNINQPFCVAPSLTALSNVAQEMGCLQTLTWTCH